MLNIEYCMEPTELSSDAQIRERRKRKYDRILTDELNAAFTGEIQWKPGILPTLIAVDSSEDGRHATVRVSILPESEEQYLLKTLEHERPAINERLFKRLGRRHIPELHFECHRGGANQTRVDALLEEIHKKEVRKSPKTEETNNEK